MDIVKAAEKFALEEIRKYKAPHRLHFEIVNKKGIELAKKLDADREVVMLGTILMDVKIGQAMKEGKIQNHVEMSIEATKKFLEKFSVGKKSLKKIINCVAAHHRDIPYICLEAEICANADCYRFLSPKGFLVALHLFASRGMNFNEAMKYAENKLEEKQKIVSLPICKKETGVYYQLIKKLINLSKV